MNIGNAIATAPLWQWDAIECDDSIQILGWDENRKRKTKIR